MNERLVPTARGGRVGRVRRGPGTMSWSRSLPLRAVRDFVQLAGKPLLAAELAVEKHGIEELDELLGAEGSGPFVIVANHASHLDAVVLLDSLPVRLRRRTAVAAPVDRFADSWWRLVGASVAFNTVPVDRSDWSLAGEPARLLGRGWNLIVFPEGSRSPDGFPGRFALDVADLAVAASVPVVPVGIRGAYAAMPKGRGWPTSGRPRISVRWGRPVLPRPDETPAELNARVADAVARLVAEDADTWWSSLRVDRRPADGAAGRPLLAGAPPEGSWRRIWEQSEPPVPGGRRLRRPIWQR